MLVDGHPVSCAATRTDGMVVLLALAGNVSHGLRLDHPLRVPNDRDAAAVQIDSRPGSPCFGATVHHVQGTPVKIHEYQAKAILARHGVPVPRGEVAFTVDE